MGNIEELRKKALEKRKELSKSSDELIKEAGLLIEELRKLRTGWEEKYLKKQIPETIPVRAEKNQRRPK